MKKFVLSILISLLFIGSTASFVLAQNPDYEKYGRIAISVVKEDYPGDEVREYQYLGRKNITETRVEDSFRFQVAENNQKFNVTVKVTHDLTSKKLLTISVESQKQ